jgi:subtilisin family serine protease
VLEGGLKGTASRVRAADGTRMITSHVTTDGWDACLRASGLDEVMALGEGGPALAVAVLDGPVAVDHPALAGAALSVAGDAAIACVVAGGAGCGHGTAVAGMLAAGRETPARGICAGVRVIVRPIFGDDQPARAEPAVLAQAIVEAIDAGAWIVNVSAAFSGAVPIGDRGLRAALDLAARRGVIVVAAAGNEGRVGGSPLVSHPWVIAVAACDTEGRPLAGTNLGASIARGGLCAPAVGVVALAAGGGYGPFGGSSAAAPQVSGAIALAWSASPASTGAEIRAAVHASAAASRRGLGLARGIAPPLLDAPAVYDHATRRGGHA